MKKLLSLGLVAAMAMSAMPMAYATTDVSNGTEVEYLGSKTTIDGEGNEVYAEAYTVTVPAKMTPGGSAFVKAEGTWQATVSWLLMPLILLLWQTASIQTTQKSWSLPLLVLSWLVTTMLLSQTMMQTTRAKQSLLLTSKTHCSVHGLVFSPTPLASLMPNIAQTNNPGPVPGFSYVYSL